MFGFLRRINDWVTLSTCSGVCCDAGHCKGSVVYEAGMLPEVGMPCFPVFEEILGAMQLAQNPSTNANSKHIDVRHHFLRELVGLRQKKYFGYPRRIVNSTCRLSDEGVAGQVWVIALFS